MKFKLFNIQYWLCLLLISAGLVLTSCSPETTSNSGSTAETASETSSPASPNSQVNNLQTEDLPRLEGMATVEMVVNGSPITIEVDGTNAPITAGNFVDLVQRGVYDGLAFHRVVREPEPFVVQGGDPKSKDASVPTQLLGRGGFIDPETNLSRYIPLEIKPEGVDEPIYGNTLEGAKVAEKPKLRHTRGAVAMARSQMPNSASSQFYIALADLEFLDGSYAVFGYVTNGIDVVDAIQAGDRIQSAKVTQGLDNLKLPGEEPTPEASPEPAEPESSEESN